MSYKTVCVAGGGVLGSQIAFQAAYCGFDVTIWLRSEGSIGRTQPKIDHVREEYIAAIEGMADGTGEWCAGIADSDQPFDKEAALAAVERAYSTLKLELDLAKAVADADLVIESMAEDTQAKIDFYKKLAPVLPQKTVVVTNYYIETVTVALKLGEANLSGECCVDGVANVGLQVGALVHAAKLLAIAKV